MFEELRKIIEENDSIVIFGHAFPDGDCYGSQIGLRETLRLNYPNKKVYAVGTGYRRFFKMIAPMDHVEDEVIQKSLAILLDGNDLSRMEDRRVYDAKAWIKIDHHVENDKFTEGPFILDTTVNSTCELIVQFIQESNWKINPTIANALFLGILTDSGRFQYIEDYAKAFHEVAWLCENGAKPDSLNSILNVTNEDALRFKGYVYSHYKKSRSGVIYITFTKKQLHSFHVSANKAGTMVNLLANVLHYPIWAFFCENLDGTCHIEMRSNGPIVQPIAAKYGGGGHRLAAGVTIPNMNPETIEPILKDLDKLIVKYKAKKERKKQYVGKRTSCRD